MSNYSNAIGIDLGTTFCCVGCLNVANEQVEIIRNNEGEKTVPSYVAFTDDKQVVGKSAKDKAFRLPQNVVYDSKRLIGKKFGDLPADTQGWSFSVGCGEDDTPLIQIPRNEDTVAYKPQEISAMLLKHMKNIAETKLGKQIKDAVITVPAYFNYHQRNATKESGQLAGLNVLKIINEPTAAALAYVHQNEITGYKNVLVFDLGGGTFDVSVVNINGGFITVRATSGDTHLGGRDFDQNLAQIIVDKTRATCNRDLAATTLRKIYELSEEIKMRLTFETSATLDFSSFEEEDVHVEVTREEFESKNMSLFESCCGIVQNCLKDAQLKEREIDNILLVGGSTRIPKLQQMLSKLFKGKPLTKAINPDEAVAYGAAVQAAMLSVGSKPSFAPKVNDVTPLSIGIDLIGGIMHAVIPRNTNIPVVATKNYVTVEDKQKIADFNIYEGERCLTKHNSMIGTFVIELPPEPPGYPLEVSFVIDVNGILKIEARTSKGIYANLHIEYGKQSVQSTNNVIQDFIENRDADHKMYNVIQKWRGLHNYCTKMRAICTYDKRGVPDEEKNKIKYVSEYYAEWLSTNQVKDGSEEEEKQIVCMQKVLETACEPIVNKYGYHVKNMPLRKFYQLITE